MSMGYLLVGHGTRNKAGCAEFLQLAAQVGDLAQGVPLAPAFLELAEPTILQAMEQLRSAGVTQVTCAPVILLSAGHVKRDIPEAVHAAARQIGMEQVSFVDHLGCRAELLEVSLDRYREALEPSAHSDPTGWVLVGRGTHDPEALAEIRQFQQLRQQLEPCAQEWLGFLAMAEPTLVGVLEQAASSQVTNVVVQPHLLFQGDLLARTAHVVEEFKQRYPTKRWLLSKHIGPSVVLAKSIAQQLAAS